MSSPVLLFAKTLGFWAASQNEAAGAGTGRSVGGQPARTLLSPGLVMSPGPGKRGATASLSLCPEGGVAQEACFQGRAAGQGEGGRSRGPGGDTLLLQARLTPGPRAVLGLHLPRALTLARVASDW